MRTSQCTWTKKKSSSQVEKRLVPLGEGLQGEDGEKALYERGSEVDRREPRAGQLALLEVLFALVEH